MQDKVIVTATPGPAAAAMRALLTALLVTSATAVAQDAADAGVATCAIDVEVTGLRDGGQVWVILFSDAQADAYPTKRDQALKRLDVAPAAGKARVSFEALECRTYAVAVVHDEDGNGKLNTNFIGIPNEGLGASRNARRAFGPPKFDDAKVRVSAGRTTLPIAIVY
jgi:uncharacterized protein (DUF2141 family)